MAIGLYKHKMHIVSTIVHGRCIYTFIDYNQFPHGADFTVTAIQRIFLDLGKDLPTNIYVQMDNTSKENKVNSIFW